jgi:hypothetical protein
MKQLILPIVIGLLAGLGGGSGYAYMKASAKFVADSTKYAEKAAADSAARDSVVKDSLARLAPPAPHDDALANPLTPADSIRALLAARDALQGAGAPHVTPSTAKHGDATKPPAAGGHDDHAPAPAGKGAAPAPAAPKAAPTTPETVVAVQGAREEALLDPIPEQRLAKIFAAMPAKEAAKVLDQMSDKDVRAILGMMNDRQAAAILPLLPPGRAATITRGAAKAPEKTP